ncbi:hypothetical protein H3C61_01250 [Candidatus Gracilibacteria bacterium]|nr:hypothetical protein [Candidatus Gracilibacteria bacterium]
MTNNNQKTNYLIFNVPEIDKRKGIKQNYDFCFKTLGVIQYNDFLKSEDNYLLLNKLVINSNNYVDDKKDDIEYPGLIINGLKIDFYYFWFHQIKANMILKDLLYIYYHFLFGVDLYTYREITFDENGNNIDVNFYIINSFYKQKELKSLSDFLIEQKPAGGEEPSEKTKRLASKIESYKRTIDIYERWKGKTVDVYEIKENDKIKKQIIITPILVQVDNQTDINSLKKILVVNKYDDNEDEEQKEKVIKTGEFFDYFIASSKRKAPELKIEKIKEDILKLGDKNNISEKEINKGIDFVNNFLSNIL